MDLSLSASIRHQTLTDTCAPSSAKSHFNFLRIHLYFCPSSPPEVEAKASGALLHHFSAEIPKIPGTSSTWPHQPCLSLLHSPLLPRPPVPLGMCIQLQKPIFPSPDELWVDAVLSQLPGQRGRSSRDLPAGQEGGQGHPLGCKFSGCQTPDLLMGF